jgi:hypothetical protein
MNGDERRTLESRAKLATIALWLFAALSIPTAIGEWLEASGAVNIDTDVGPLVMTVGLSYLGYVAAMVLAILMVARWIYCAHANLRDAGIQELEFTPGWAVGWYFVPIANLFKPYQAMRELWTACHGEDNHFGGEAPAEAKVWWSNWLVGNIISGIGTRISLIAGGDSETKAIGYVIDVASTALLMIAAFFLIKLVKEITHAQLNGAFVAEIFA